MLCRWACVPCAAAVIGVGVANRVASRTWTGVVDVVVVDVSVAVVVGGTREGNGRGYRQKVECVLEVSK